MTIHTKVISVPREAEDEKIRRVHCDVNCCVMRPRSREGKINNASHIGKKIQSSS